MPHVVVGATAFWDREEVKDMLAFLRLALKPGDSAALGRVANKPARGLGDKGMEELQVTCRMHNRRAVCSLTLPRMTANKLHQRHGKQREESQMRSRLPLCSGQHPGAKLAPTAFPLVNAAQKMEGLKDAELKAPHRSTKHLTSMVLRRSDALPESTSRCCCRRLQRMRRAWGLAATCFKAARRCG